jgi:hypothetical protein
MNARSTTGLLIVVILVVYRAVLVGDFTFLASWDDAANIVDNPAVNRGSLEIWRTAWG